MRHYSFDRDEDGRVFRMVWQGDFTDVCPLTLRCSCGSTRIKANRCFDCWKDHGRDSVEISYEDAGIYRAMGLEA